MDETVNHGVTEHSAGHTGEPAPAAGMPQLNPATYPSQLFWLAVTFVMLYIALARFVLPRIGRVLETRRSRIDTDLAQATTLKNEAEAARDAYEKGLAEARAKSQALLAEALGAHAKAAAARQAELDAALAQKLGEAEQRIREARTKAQASLTPVAAELAGLIVEKLAHARPSNEELARAVARSNHGQGA